MQNPARLIVRIALVVVLVGVVVAFVRGGSSPRDGGNARGTLEERRRTEKEARAARRAELDDEAQAIFARIPEKHLNYHPLLAELLFLKAKDGLDNALIHYEIAAGLQPERNQELDELVDRVIQNGWDDVEAAPLVPWLDAWQPTLAEIRKGAAVGYARGIGAEKGPSTPVPDFNATVQAGKALRVEGRRLESQARYGDALDNYLTLLTFGHDCRSAGSTLFSHLIGVSMESRALRQLHRLARAGVLEGASLGKAAAHLRQIAETMGRLSTTLEGEKESALVIIDSVRNAPEPVWAPPGMTHQESFGGKVYSLWQMWFEEGPRQGWQTWRHARQMTTNLGKAEADAVAVYGFSGEYLDAPWWERDPVAFRNEFDMRLADCHPLLQIIMAGAGEVKTRCTVVSSRLGETRLAAALETWKLGADGAYPETLAELAPEHFQGTLPIDPFSGQDFLYVVPSGGGDYGLYGVGPDGQDDEGRIAYDPTNGSLSRGDLAFGR